MKRWHVRAGAPNNRFQAFLCWCLGWDVYFGVTPPWHTFGKSVTPDEAEDAPPHRTVERLAPPPIPKERPSL